MSIYTKDVEGRYPILERHYEQLNLMVKAIMTLKAAYLLEMVNFDHFRGILEI